MIRLIAIFLLGLMATPVSHAITGTDLLKICGGEDENANALCNS